MVVESSRLTLTEEAFLGPAISHHSENSLQTLADCLFEGVITIDSGGRISFANRSAMSLLHGTDRQAWHGRSLDDIVRLEQEGQPVACASGPWARVIALGETFLDRDAVILLSDRTRLAVSIACTPLLQSADAALGASGVPIGAVLSFHEIGLLKLEQREALQASKLASVGQLASGIAHEINTPIQYIGDNLRFLSEAFEEVGKLLQRHRALLDHPAIPESLREEQRDLLEELDVDYLVDNIPLAIAQSLEGVGHVTRIVLAMKEFAHPGEQEKVPVDVNRSLSNTLAVSRNEWKHVAELSLSLSEELPKIVGLAGALNQVFLNFIVNAAQAIGEAKLGRLGRLTVTTRQIDDQVEIVFADDGIGMSEAVKARIYDPFFTTKSVGQGTGQGLAICHDVIVNKHGGTISVSSEPGRGSRFVITLPIDGGQTGDEGPQ